jgi:hypothetical protein
MPDILKEHRWTIASHDDPIEQKRPEHRDAQHSVPMSSLRLCWPKQDERNNKKNVGRENNESAIDQQIEDDLALSPVEPMRVGFAPEVPDSEQNDHEKQGKDQRA